MPGKTWMFPYCACNNTQQMTCISCAHEHDQKFCPNCGEQAAVGRITFPSIAADFFSTLTNMDKGLLFNLKYLTINPHYLITSYIRGKRKGIFNPFSFLILSISIFLIADSLVDFSSGPDGPDSPAYSIGYKAGTFLRVYFKYVWIFTIGCLGISTKLFFGQYNLAEHVTIGAFFIGQATLAGLIGFFALKAPVLLFNPVVYLAMFWMVYNVFGKGKDQWEALLQTAGVILFFFLQLFLVLILIGLAL